MICNDRRRWKLARRRFAAAVLDDDPCAKHQAAWALLCASDRLAPALDPTAEAWRALRRWRRMAVRVVAGERLREIYIERCRAVANTARNKETRR